MNGKPSDRPRGDGFLSRLAHDTGGNTLAMMAAFTIPLAALAGSAVDMARSYLVRVRLQQACDAGVLAGRKLMIVTSGTTLDPSAPSNPSAPDSSTPVYKQAKAFFDNNFPSGWMQTSNVSFTPSRMSDGQVTATATATMPMAIMKMFGFNQTTQTVTCNARLDIGDTDIMFVLDTTGSMACVTGSGCSTITTYTREDGSQGYYRVEQTNSKMAGLRSAVVTFYNTLAANAPATAHIRYGFVPYASSVNVGAIIMDNSSAASGQPVNPGNPAYIVNSWNYQSRELATDQNSSTLPTSSNRNNYTMTAGQYYQGEMLYGTAPTGQSVTAANKQACLDLETRKVGTTDYARGTWPTSGTVVRKFPVWASSACKTYAWNVKPMWRYKQMTYDVSNYKNSLGVSGTAVVDPSKITGATSKWAGCIEERDTTATNTFTQGSLPADLDPDLVPTSDATRWRPMWPEAVYYRAGTSNAVDTSTSTSSVGDSSNRSAGDNYTSPSQSFNMTSNFYACGKAAQRLKTMSLSDVQTYISATGDFRALGYTYHDVGMTWGLRLLSPQGIWKEDTGAWPGNNPPSRYIVFMSDGALQTNDDAYYTYGLEYIDKRATGGTLNDHTNHNARFQAVCTAAKNKGITVFVVAFDTSLTTDMTNCATPGYAYTASDSAALSTAFANIAKQIVKLRLSQ